MRFVSTRGKSVCDFSTAVMTGLAPDGGLFVPDGVPDISRQVAAWRGQSFTELFQTVITPYVGDHVSPDVLRGMIRKAFSTFDTPDVTPLVQAGPLHILELFHGPTLAFKDVALQFLGHLFEHLLEVTGRRLTIVGATSGDTGSAAIHALRGRKNLEVFILFPKGRVSRMQELQMTTVPDANVHCIAVEGTFDDAQDIVKGAFNDRAFNERYQLSAVNSINWARVMAQITYFFWAYYRLLDQRRGMKMGDPMAVSVPTGNFGHIFAGVLARRMGLPIGLQILATNANNILDRFVQTGEYRKGKVHQTYSPSMDIQVASNFERYLHDLAGGDGARVNGWLDSLRKTGGFRLSQGMMRKVWGDFDSAAVDDPATIATMREVHTKWGYLLDPHSAIGVRATLDRPKLDMPVVTMATAHPAKFNDAIRKAVGFDAPLPPALADLERHPTRVKVLPARLEAVQAYMQATLP
ncbi:MAG TPA: threonine synthase [bacterium]